MQKEGLSILKIGKKGQVTLFIIIALIIVAGILAFYFLSPNLGTGSGFDESNPEEFIQLCLEEKLQETIETISLQGGSMEPEHYFTYNSINIEYLCYTNEGFELCTIQQPLLKQHIENEIRQEILGDVERCFNSLEESYDNRGYNSKLDSGITTISLLPNRVVANMNYIVTVSQENTERFDEFNVVVNNNLYELIGIAESIMNIEATSGEADVRIYNTLYPNIKVEKNLRDDGTRIYKINERETGDLFQFASRSLVLIPGH